MIRSATSADYPAILPIFLELLHTHAAKDPSTFKLGASQSEVLLWLSEILLDQRARTYVAVEEGEVVGYLFAMENLKQEGPIRPARHYLSLEHVAVRPEHRRRGIASALLGSLLAEAKAKNIDRIELDVWAFNEAAQRFFARQGFKGVSQHMISELQTK